MEVTINHDQEGQEFTATLGSDQAELSYAKPDDKIIDFTHTFVPECFRGKGVADQLIRTALAYAEQQQMRVIASCPAVSSFIRRHKEYQPLLESGEKSGE